MGASKYKVVVPDTPAAKPDLPTTFRSSILVVADPIVIRAPAAKPACIPALLVSSTEIAKVHASVATASAPAPVPVELEVADSGYPPSAASAPNVTTA